ncbi:MAG: cellulose biosynthesis cyclic di-GMP-binding regulatory protein BcsB [Verrucomicrobiota bacterium]
MNIQSLLPLQSSKIKKRFSSFLLFLILISSLSSSVQGEVLSDSKNHLKYQAPINQFMSENQQMILRSTRGEYYIDIPLADRVELQSALLHLEYVNSISLLEERSQLRIVLNEQVIAQVPLRRNQPEGKLDLNLPLPLFKPGYNRLKFMVAQHYTIKCEDPNAPELWTQINTEASTLHFEGNSKTLPARLSQLGKLFDSKKWGPQQLNIVMPAALESDSPLKWGSLIAQGVALRLEYTPLQVSLGHTLSIGSDNIVIGTNSQLKSLMPTEQFNEIQGSYLGLVPMSGSSNFLFIISGRDDAEVTRAATAFCYLNFPMPDAPSMIVHELRLPEVEKYIGRSAIRENTEYRFSQLGFETSTFKGINRGVDTGVFRINLNAPADLYFHEDQQMELLLHFAHGAAFRKDCVLNVSINDVFSRAVQLSDESGASYRNYKIEIPMRSLRPGSNILKITPQLVPLMTDFCAIIQEENLLFTLFEDSRLKIPKGSHFAQLPDLRLFSRTSFPFSSKPDGSELTVQVASKDQATIAAAWTLLAKLAQKTGLPMQNLDISFQPNSKKNNLMIVGALGQIPADVMKAAPLGLGEIKRFVYEQRSTQVSHGKDADVTSPQMVTSELNATASFGQYGVAMEFQSPFANEKTIFLVAAEDTTLLSKRVSQLVESTSWEALKGDVMVWSDEPSSLATQKVGSSYSIGSYNTQTRCEYLFSKHPFLWAAIILVILSLFALITWKLLARFKNRQHGNAPEVDGKS